MGCCRKFCSPLYWAVQVRPLLLYRSESLTHLHSKKHKCTHTPLAASQCCMKCPFMFETPGPDLLISFYNGAVIGSFWKGPWWEERSREDMRKGRRITEERKPLHLLLDLWTGCPFLEGLQPSEKWLYRTILCFKRELWSLLILLVLFQMFSTLTEIHLRHRHFCSWAVSPILTQWLYVFIVTFRPRSYVPLRLVIADHGADIWYGVRG